MPAVRRARLMSLVAIFAAAGCTKEGKVENAIQDALEKDAKVASALCGFSAQGLNEVTVSSLALAEATGTAMVSGKPVTTGAPAAATCSGSISFLHAPYKGRKMSMGATKGSRSTHYAVWDLTVTSKPAAPKI